jgi:uncharacterized protein
VIDKRGQVLLSLARAALTESLGGAPVKVPDLPWLKAPGACFVTLTREGALRGCVGSLAAIRPLGEDVIHNARGAAFDDPRFPALAAAELKGTRIEVTVLSSLEKLDVQTEEEAIAMLRPGVDGVHLSWGMRRAVFIPQMWEKLPDPKRFLAVLREKAGLPKDRWSSGTRLERFTATRWEEGTSQ